MTLLTIPELLSAAAGLGSGLIESLRRARAGSGTGGALVALAARARLLGSDTGPSGSPQRALVQGAPAVEAVLSWLLLSPVDATVECDGQQIAGQVHWEEGRLHFASPAASVALAGKLRLSARAGRLEISGFSRVVAVVSDGVMLSAPRTFETVDCRGPRRFTAMHGAESLGLWFIPDGAERSCPVIELSLAGASVLAVSAQELPGAGDRVSGSLVFLDQGLVRVEAEVRHVTRVANGLRVGLSFREIEAGECSVSDVVDALAT